MFSASRYKIAILQFSMLMDSEPTDNENGIVQAQKKPLKRVESNKGL